MSSPPPLARQLDGYAEFQQNRVALLPPPITNCAVNGIGPGAPRSLPVPTAKSITTSISRTSRESLIFRESEVFSRPTGSGWCGWWFPGPERSALPPTSVLVLSISNTLFPIHVAGQTFRNNVLSGPPYLGSSDVPPVSPTN